MDQQNLSDYFGTKLEAYRTKLLNLSLRNPLLKYRHSARGRSYLRVIDTTPDLFLAAIKSGSQALSPLPPQAQVFEEEEAKEFKVALEQAKHTDEAYLEALNAIEVGGKQGEVKRAKVDLELINRVRALISLAPRKAELPADSWAKQNGINPNYDLSGVGENLVPEALADRLQTKLYREDLEKTLKKLTGAAKKSEQETGISSLYAAIGFLSWYESESSDKEIISPILLQPVTLEKNKGRQATYQLFSEDETETNITLVTKLRDFGVELPHYDVEVFEGVEPYLREIGSLTAKFPRWHVKRFITVAQFNFARLVLYKDLNPSENPGIAQNGIVRGLLEGAEHEGADFAETYDVDKPEVLKQLRPLIENADSSQLSAIKDALDGKNLVIKGPPGTGKSQTITNIIAAALAKGRSVLFVAEKAAALEVVKNRLDQAGLGVFCLPLHSTKATRPEVVKAFKERLEFRLGHNPGQLVDKRNALDQDRETLNEYVATMKEGFGATEYTVQELFWVLQQVRRSELAPELKGIKHVSGITEMSRQDILMLEQTFTTYTAKLSSLGLKRVSDHPWYGLATAGLSTFDQDTLAADLEAFEEHLRSFTDVLGEAELSFLPQFGCLRELEEFAQRFISLSELPRDVNVAWLTSLQSPQKRAAAQSYAKQARELTMKSRALNDLKSAYSEVPELGLQHLTDVVETAKKVDLVDVPVQQLQRRLEQASAERVQFEEMSKTVLSALTLSGLADIPINEIYVERLKNLGGQVGDVSASVLKMRSDVFEQDITSELERAKHDFEALKLSLSDMGLTFQDLEHLDAQTFEEAAQALREAGFFAFFSQKVKAAGRIGSQYLPDFAGLKRRERLTLLTKAAGIIRRAQHFENAPELKELLGGQFKGFYTNWDLLSETVTFYRRLDEALPAVDHFNLTLYKFLCQEPVTSVQAFQVHLNSLKGFTFDFKGGSHQEVAAELESREQILAELIIFAETQHIPSHLSFAQVLELIELREDVDSLRRRVEADELAAELISVSESGEVDIEVLEHHLELTETLDLQGDPVWEVFSRPDWRELSGQRDTSFAALKIASEKVEASWEELEASFNVDVQLTFGDSLADVELSTALPHLERCRATRQSLPDFIKLKNSEAELKREPIVARMLESTSLSILAPQFKHFVYYNLVRQVFEKFPRLNTFEGQTHEQVRARFRKLDKEVVELERQEVIASTLRASRGRVPAGSNVNRSVGNYTEKAAIVHQTNLDRPSLSIRRLLEQAPKAAVGLKPCFMMSPLSVGTYLSAGNYDFDLVIIDEASQMFPEDALSAIARGKQLIVVGDPEQLPPSSFFAASQAEDEDDDDGPLEKSILELASTRYRPMRELLFHYRSRHESLIAFSNKHFYEDRLVIFPSPQGKSDVLGVMNRYVPEGQYQKGAGLNVPEAEALIEEAIAFMETYPHRSLGIAAINKKQADYLEFEFERLREPDSVVEAYISTWQDDLESFFVKNLENVQGDERDAIFVSTVYGPLEAGSESMPQRFGPINSAAGYRRLNVLFTRAKHHLRLFTSMKPSHVVPRDGGHRGVRVLKDYLEYASTGRLDSGEVDGKEPDSDFERFVLGHLRRAGYEAVCQVGVAGYRIDIGVRDPRDHDRFILGVECDGASYHSSRSARDRDRIRQDVLEGLGWDIHRIWSTDWFSNPQKEFEKLEAKLKQFGGNISENNTVTALSKEMVEVEEAPQTLNDIGAVMLALEVEESIASFDPGSAVKPVQTEQALEARPIAPQVVQGELLSVRAGYRVTYRISGRDSSKTVVIDKSIDGWNYPVISMAAPVAKGLLGAHEGDEVTFELPHKIETAVVEEIEKPSS